MENLQPIEDLELSRDSEETSKENTSTPRWQKVAIVIISFFAFCFILLSKLPEAKIQNLVISHTRIITQAQGIGFSAEKVRLSFIFGLAVKLYNIELKNLEDETQTLKLEYVKIKPSLLGLLQKKTAFSLMIEGLDGTVDGSFSLNGPNTEVDLDISKINTAKTNLLKKFMPFEINAILNGNISLKLNSDAANMSEGLVKLAIEGLTAPSQNVMGFNLPKLKISSVNVDVPIKSGLLQFQNFELGKDPKSDDIVGKVTGDITMDKFWDRSKVNAKATFQLSQGVMSSFPFIESILSSAKQSDGKYAYRLSGTVSSLEPTPGG